MRVLAVLMLIAPISAFAVNTPAGVADACSGDNPPFQLVAPSAAMIFLGTATDVGDNINRAPTLGPTSPPVATPSPGSTHHVNLAGVRTSFRVDAVYVGEVPDEYVTGEETRRRLESDLRAYEAGRYVGTSCPMDAFVPRYQRDVQYLLFIDQTNPWDFVAEAFRVEGDQVVFDDDLLNGANFGFLQADASTLASFFPGLALNSNGFPITDRVPLADVLAAIASLRGDTTITPPNTGTAGLKDGGAR